MTEMTTQEFPFIGDVYRNADQTLRPDKDLIDVRVENKTPVGDVRAVKLRARRIWTVNNAIGFMGISFAHWILPLRRILFRRLLRSNLFCYVRAGRAFLRHLIWVDLILGLRFIILIAATSHLSDCRLSKIQGKPTYCSCRNNCDQSGFHIHNIHIHC